MSMHVPYELTITYSSKCYGCDALMHKSHTMAPHVPIPAPGLAAGWTLLPFGQVLCPKHRVEYAIVDVEQP